MAKNMFYAWPSQPYVGLSPNCCLKGGTTQLYSMPLYAVALRFALIRIKSPKPTPA